MSCPRYRPLGLEWFEDRTLPAGVGFHPGSHDPPPRWDSPAAARPDQPNARTATGTGADCDPPGPPGAGPAGAPRLGDRGPPPPPNRNVVSILGPGPGPAPPPQARAETGNGSPSRSIAGGDALPAFRAVPSLTGGPPGGIGNPPGQLAEAGTGEIELFVPISVTPPAEAATPAGRDLPARVVLALPAFDVATTLALLPVPGARPTFVFPSPEADAPVPEVAPAVPVPTPVVVPTTPPPHEPSAVAVAFPDAAAVAGALGLNLDRLEEGVRELLDRVAGIAGIGDGADGTSDWSTWLAVGGLLCGWAGYEVWAGRAGRIAPRAVTIRWGNHDNRLG